LNWDSGGMFVLEEMEERLELMISDSRANIQSYIHCKNTALDRTSRFTSALSSSLNRTG
jgi:hypothetical protein